MKIQLPVIRPANDNARPDEAPANDNAKTEIDRVLEPLHPALQAMLRPALVQHPNDKNVSSAMQLLAWAGTFGKGSHAVIAALMGAGALRDGTWHDKTALDEPLDPVPILAARSEPGAADDEAAVTALKDALAPLTQTKEWIDKPHESNRRGVLGEVLRTHSIEHDPKDEGLVTERGLLVLDRAPGLENATTGAEADAICAANGYDSQRLFRYKDKDGRLCFALQLTEIDVLVAERTETGLRPVRFENVKAGVGSSGTARKQNRLAADTFASKTGVFARQTEQGPRDVTHTFDRSGVKDVELKTVGPPEDPSYDVALPLSAHDITVLSHRLAS